MENHDLYNLLETQYLRYNNSGFIEADPISIPHRFIRRQDIEIAGFFTSILAWGNRKVIIRKCGELMDLMGNAPFDFVLNHSDYDLRPLAGFKHRTFNTTDLLYFIYFLKNHYSEYSSLEDAFLPNENDSDVKMGLIRFHQTFTNDEHFPTRTAKHISTPARNSACKRLNMYLRWMVRRDEQKVDFGIWTRIDTSQLICPCDVHVERVARSLGLIRSSTGGWKMAKELTEALKQLDARDPVKYDFALFGMGIDGKY